MSEPVDGPSPRPWNRRSLRLGVVAVVVGIVGYFFSRALRQNWDEIRAEDISFDVRFVLATVLFTVAVPMSGYLWTRILRTISRADVGAWDGVATHCTSWLMKYVPGQVGAAVNKVVWGADRGIGRGSILLSFVYENVLQQMASIGPALVIIVGANAGGAFGEGQTTLLIAVAAAAAMAVAIAPPVFRPVVTALAQRLFGTTPQPHQILSARVLAGHLALFTIPRVINGVAFVFLVDALFPVGADAWVPLAAIYVLAGAIGVLAVFVPSGIGVREGVIAVLATQYLTSGEAVIAALVARLLSTIGDVGVAGVVAGARILHRRSTTP